MILMYDYRGATQAPLFFILGRGISIHMEHEFVMECIVPRHIKVMWIAFAAVVALLILWLQRENWMVWALFIYMTLRVPLYSPDVQVYSDGVEVNRFGFKNFLHWSDIRGVRVSKLNSQIFPRNISNWVGWLFYDFLLINFWRTNYKDAMEYIKNHVETTQQLNQGRVYE